MKLEWVAAPTYHDLEVVADYRAWGIIQPYRITITAGSKGFVLVTDFLNHDVRRRHHGALIEALRDAERMAQAWEDDVQRDHDALGLVAR